MKRKKRKRIFILLFSFIPIFSYYLFFKSNFFNINKIEIGGENLECATMQQIIDSSKILGRNFFLLDTKAITENVKSKFICVSNILFYKSLPNKVKIDVVSRKPKAVILNLKNDEATTSSIFENIATPSAQDMKDGFLLDEQGVIFSKNDDLLNIPRILINDPTLSLSKTIDINILKVLEKVKIFGIDINFSTILDNSLAISSSPKVIFNLNNNLDTQIASLQLILEKAKIDSEVLEFIDLRFDKPIVRLAPKK